MPEFKQLLKNDSDTKIKIFKVAAKSFAEKGYNGVSMREISEKSHVTKPTIYYYFGSKEGIYKALIEFGLHHGAEKAQEIANLNIPSKEKLTKLIQDRFRVSVEHPEFAKFFLSVFITTEDLPFIESFEKEANKHRELFKKIIKDGVASGEFGAGANPELAVEIIFAVFGYFIRKQFKSKKRILSDELAEEIVELLFKGLND